MNLKWLLIAIAVFFVLRRMNQKRTLTTYEQSIAAGSGEK